MIIKEEQRVGEKLKLIVDDPKRDEKENG